MPPDRALARDVPRGAVAIITDAAGRLLLHLRDDIPGIVWPGHWSVLGGGADPGEHPDDAIVRELKEEAGLVLATLTPLFEIPDRHGSGQLISVYHGHWDGEPALLPLAEGRELRFFPPSHLPALKIPPYLRDAIDRWAGMSDGSEG
ncbi:MAG: 8-oxo-dGTP diphosphatase [Actinomycetota bacterium]|nr:8-oxo-dGTP diphosphatase [Actinomycetota bacterium]